MNAPPCTNCIHFLHVPFTVGKCVRNPRFDAGTGAIIYPSIADYRTDRCGLKEPRFFKAKETA